MNENGIRAVQPATGGGGSYFVTRHTYNLNMTAHDLRKLKAKLLEFPRQN